MKDNLGALGQVLVTLFGLGLLALGVWGLYGPDEFLRKADMGKDEFAKLAVTIDAKKIDPKNQGKPVIATGELTCQSLLKDPGLGPSFPGAVSAYREVTMRQYDERWEGSGDSERLAGYNLIWSEVVEPCPSRPNPPMPLGSQVLVGKDYKVGAFTIPRELALEIEGKAVVLPNLRLDKRTAGLGTWDQTAGAITCKRRGPQGVGDLRIRYLVQEPCQVTVMGVQQGDRLEPYIDVSGSQTYAILKGAATPAATRKVAGDADSRPSLGWARFKNFWPLWLGFFILFCQRWRSNGKALNAVLATMAAPLVMVLVHLAVWKVLPKMVL